MGLATFFENLGIFKIFSDRGRDGGVPSSLLESEIMDTDLLRRVDVHSAVPVIPDNYRLPLKKL